MVLIAMESLINGEEKKMMKEEFCFLFFSFFSTSTRALPRCSTIGRYPKLSITIRPARFDPDRQSDDEAEGKGTKKKSVRFERVI
jgi:hypothetical protein